MATLEERLKDNEYKLWVKAGICLASVKHGLEVFTEERSEKAHGFVKDALKNNNSFHKICGNVKVTFKKQKWSIGCCNGCQVYVDELVRLRHAPFKFKQSNWNNTDIQLWPNEPWEMVKVYMNEGQKPFHKSSKDTDLSGLLNFINHCSVPRIDIHDKQNLNTVREGRNIVMHSAAMKLCKADFDLYTNAMIDLLEDPLFLCKIKDAQEAAKIIKEVQQATFHISKQAEFELLKDKTAEIEIQNEKLQQDVDQLKSQYQEMETSTDTKMKSIRGLVEQEANQRVTAIDALKDDISQKENRIKELQTELILVKKLINQDKDLYIKMDMRVKNVETTLEKTNEEFRYVKQSHTTLIQQVNQIQTDLDAGKPANWHASTTADFQAIKKRNVELERMAQELKMQLEDHDELKSRNKQLENQVALLKRDQSAVNPSEKEIEDEKVLTLTDTNKKLTNQVQELQNELEQTRSRIIVSETDLRDRKDALEYENTILKDEIARLKSDRNRDATEQEMQKLRGFNSYLEATLDKSSFEIVTLGSNIKTLNTEVQMEQNASKILKLKINNITLESARERKEYTDSLTGFKTYIQEIERSKEANERLLKHSKDRVDALETNNETLKQSEFTLQNQVAVLTRTGEESMQAHRKEENMTLALQGQIRQLSFDGEEKAKELKENEILIQELLESIASQGQEIDSLKSTSLHEQENNSTKQIQRPLPAESVGESSDKSDSAESGILESSTKDIKVAIAIQVDVSHDNVSALISGGVFLSGGELVLCDNKNKTISVLSNTFKAIGTLDLQGQPWDVSVVESNTVIVTLPYSKKLKYIQVLPKMREIHDIGLDMMCWGIVVVGNDIYTTHCNKLGEGEVVVLDKDGTLKRNIRVHADLDTPYLFKNPENITVSASGNIYVSDNDTDTVTCLDPSGSIVYSYTDPDLQSPGGLCIDDRGHIIVCGYGSNNLQVLTPEGRKLRTLLTSKTPMSLAYRHNDDTLVVGCDDNNVLAFELRRLFTK